MNIKKLALCALLAALSVVILYIPALIPSVKISMAALAGLCAAAALIEAGAASGVMVYAVSCALALLVVPVKAPVVLYAAFFGYYPVVKSFAEKPVSRVPEWIIKLLVFNAAAVLFWNFGGLFVGELSLPSAAPYALLFAANIVFVLYDVCLTRLVALYISRISPKLRKMS